MRCDKEIDKVVGARIKELRIMSGISRVQLAEKISITQQQLQKYETGMNRVCVSRLLLICDALNKSTSYFLGDIDKRIADVDDEFVSDKHQTLAINVSRNFMKIKNPAHQVVVNILIKSLAE